MVAGEAPQVFLHTRLTDAKSTGTAPEMDCGLLAIWADILGILLGGLLFYWWFFHENGVPRLNVLDNYCA